MTTAIRGSFEGKPTLRFTDNMNDIATADDVAFDVDDRDLFMAEEAERILGRKPHDKVRHWNTKWDNGKTTFEFDEYGEYYAYSHTGEEMISDLLDILSKQEKVKFNGSICLFEYGIVKKGDDFLMLDPETAKKKIKAKNKQKQTFYEKGEINTSVLQQVYFRLCGLLIKNKWGRIILDRVSNSSVDNSRLSYIYKVTAISNILDALGEKWYEVEGFDELLKYEEGLKTKQKTGMFKMNRYKIEVSEEEVIKDFLTILDEVKNIKKG